MKKLYSYPTADICLLDSEDVLTTSGLVGDGRSISNIISQSPAEGDKVYLNW